MPKFKRSPWAAAAAVLLACSAAAPMAANAEIMRATVTGTVIAGGDAYSNTVLLGANDGTSLVGQTASAFITYDSAKFGPNYPGNSPNWLFTHSPGYPDLIGTQGQGPVLSAGFSVNGITLATDTSGISENAKLQVLNPTYSPGYGENDSWGLNAGDARGTWCLADRQCVETVQLYASQTYATTDLFGGQRPFDPADSFTAHAGTYRTVGAYVRLLRTSQCPLGVCPSDALADGQTHWVEFYIDNATVTVTSAVPEPATWALWLAGVAGLRTLRRNRPDRG